VFEKKNCGLRVTVGLLLLVPGTLPLAQDRSSCNELFLSEAARMEAAYRATVKASDERLKAIFASDNFAGDKERAGIAKGAFIALFQNKFQPPIAKVQSLPAAYRKVAAQKTDPPICSMPKKLAKLPHTSDVYIESHKKMWGEVLAAAQQVIEVQRKLDSKHEIDDGVH
jgi:hypothetical protein